MAVPNPLYVDSDPPSDDTKVLVLLESRADLLALIAKNIPNIIARIHAILEAHGKKPEEVSLQIGIYGDYKNGKENIYKNSSWESTADNLVTFMGTEEVKENNCKGAVELALHHAVRLQGLTQIILIGATAPTPQDQLSYKLTFNHGLDYWKEACPDLTHASDYLSILTQKRVKISTIHMDADAKEEFEKMADNTGA